MQIKVIPALSLAHNHEYITNIKNIININKVKTVPKLPHFLFKLQFKESSTKYNENDIGIPQVI